MGEGCEDILHSLSSLSSLSFFCFLSFCYRLFVFRYIVGQNQSSRSLELSGVFRVSLMFEITRHGYDMAIDFHARGSWSPI